MSDLRTKYLGFDLINPLVISASPLSRKVDNVKKLEDAGASAVVLYSLFEEQLMIESQSYDYFLNRGIESFAEAITYFPDLDNFKVGPDNYLDHIRKLKETVDIPIIGSLNGISTGGWINISKQIEDAGADALELNLYYIPTDSNVSGDTIEKLNIDIISKIKKNISIPLSVKLSPFYTSLPNLISQLHNIDVNGIVLFNRFLQPDLDIDNFEIKPINPISTPQDLYLPLRWTAILYNDTKLDIGISGGVHSGRSMVKSILAGASSCLIASEIIKNGFSRISEMLSEFSMWMNDNAYDTIGQMKGAMSQNNITDPAAYERANYMKALSSYEDHLPF